MELHGASAELVDRPSKAWRRFGEAAATSNASRQGRRRPYPNHRVALIVARRALRALTQFARDFHAGHSRGDDQ
jgi:hypothetical protein